MDLRDYKVRIFETGVSNGLLINSPLGFYVGERSTISIKENSRDLYVLNANKKVTWSINDGIDKDKFIINASTGDLSFRLAPDYEDPTDSGNDNSYVVTLQATDMANNTADHTITFTVDDVDEIPPLITGPSGDAGDSVSTKLINENISNVHTFIANETVTWSITGGVDKDKFIINSSTGDLSFQSAPDYENPTDSGNDHSYVVTVRATDQAENTSDQELTITIEDIDDTPPFIEGPSGKSGDLTSTISILENNTVVYTLSLIHI